MQKQSRVRSLKIGLTLLFALIMFAQVAAQPATYTPDTCPFDAAPNIECGYVTVPESHANPDGNTLRIAVVIIKGTDNDAPVMLLSGGPGEITTPNAGGLGGVLQQLLGGRTVILFDQRGVGRSEPALACPEWVDAQFAMLAPDISAEDALALSNASLVACANRLESEGINLDAFNSLENAADVPMIARALGYEQVNLLGISYGSLLAQHVMRQTPEIVRAAVIDSVLPLEESFFVGSIDTVISAINRLFTACQADAACNAAYPDLDATLRETIARYNAAPLPITLTHPLTGEAIPSVLTGDNILTTVAYFLYRTPDIPALPSAIVDIANGNLTLAETLANQYLSAFYALERGMQYSVQCAEDLLLVTEQDFVARYNALAPEYRGRAYLEAVLDNSPFDVCAQWPIVPLDVGVKAPLVSDLPVLALGGQLDPVTPPTYAAQVTANLANAFTYTFPGVGHSVLLASECAQNIVGQFLNAPMTEPDASCIDSMALTFRVPGVGVELEPFNNTDFGVSGVIPTGWQVVGPGVYAPSASASIVIIQQAAPITVEELQTLLAQQFGIAEFPQASSTREANGLTWSLYETTGPAGLLADVALASGGEARALVIVLLSTELDRATYYDGLFVPAIDAFKGNS